MITSKDFLSSWARFVTGFVTEQMTHGKSLPQLWQEANTWPHGTIGPAHTGCSESPFGDFLAAQLNAANKEYPWRYQKEYRGFDLALSRRENLPMPYLWTENDRAHWDAQFRPTSLDIVIEQESACGISWREMIKLLQVRASLKVLITYTSDVNGQELSLEKSTEHIEGTKSMFQTMIRSSWNELPEEQSSEYLLMIGQLDERNAESKLNWHSWSFPANGQEAMLVCASEIAGMPCGQCSS